MGEVAAMMASYAKSLGDAATDMTTGRTPADSHVFFAMSVDRFDRICRALEQQKSGTSMTPSVPQLAGTMNGKANGSTAAA